MDGSPPASRFTRFGLVGCLALLCWVALRFWTPAETPLLAVDQEGHLSAEEFSLPSGQPLIDWSLFRFPSLEVSLEGLKADLPPGTGNLLALLEPRNAARISDVGPAFVSNPELEWTPQQQGLSYLSPADLERLTAVARGIDVWFPDDGLFHPWSVIGFNTSRAWRELGYWWSRTVPHDLGAAAVQSTLTGQQRWQRLLRPTQPSVPLRLVGPRLTVGPTDRLAMVPTPVPSQELAIDGAPFTIAEPIALFAQLERLAERPESALWACEVDHRVRQLCTGSLRDANELAATLKRLDRLHKQARDMAGDCRDESLRTDLLQAHYGLSRRVNRWQLAADLHQRRTNLWARRSTYERLQKLLQGDALVADPSLVHSLRPALVAERPLTTAERRALSRAILASSRLAQSDSNLGATLSGALDDELQTLLADKVDVQQLSTNLEVLETESSPRAAQEIVAGQQQLDDSADERHRQLAHEIEDHYRNANFRLAVSGELLNRWLPEQPLLTQSVRDRIAGSPVRGQARTQTELFIRLVPDPFIWRFGLEASGEVAALTTSGEGSVAVRSEGATKFEARKLLLVRADGVQAWPAVAKADATQRLLGVSSSYDQIPLMGSYVRSQALDEYHRRREIARREVEQKVAYRARTTLDEQTQKWLEDIEQRARSRVLRRAEDLGLEIKPIELRTTNSRLIARLRLANENQLASYTPRPQAPADSVLSVQVHDSALTNALQGLKLAGRRLTPTELVDLLQEKLDYVPERVPDAGQRTEFVFADNPVQIRFEKGSARLTLAIAELKHDRSLVRDFKVHAIYRPEVTGISAQLVRDGTLQMEGRLRHADRARLHAVFGKVLAEDRPIELVRFPSDEDTAQRLAGLMVTQLVIDDGWLGMSIGPEDTERTAVKARFVR